MKDRMAVHQELDALVKQMADPAITDAVRTYLEGAAQALAWALERRVRDTLPGERSRGAPSEFVADTLRKR
jgi:hypothetical protein